MIRSYSIRVEVIRNGATVTELQSISAPAIDCESTAIIKTSMTGIFRANPLVNWLTDEIKPYQIIDGEEYPVGVFPLGTKKNMTDKDGMETVMIECYDRGKYLNETKTEGWLHLTKGENYVTIVEQLMVRAGIILYLSTKSAEVLASDREEWEPGTPYLEIINQLLAEINYDQVWFDENGIAIVRPHREPAAANINHQYTTEDSGLKVLHRPVTKELDIFNAANVFLLTCNNPDLPAPLTAKAENNNPISALSIQNRGRRILKMIRVDNVPNQETLDAMASRVCNNSMLASETVTISTANLPGHTVLDTVAIIHPDVQGIFQETGWHMVMEAGTPMIHNLRRSVII